jgi:hypothetical protein
MLRDHSPDFDNREIVGPRERRGGPVRLEVVADWEGFTAMRAFSAGVKAKRRVADISDRGRERTRPDRWMELELDFKIGRAHV